MAKNKYFRVVCKECNKDYLMNLKEYNLMVKSEDSERGARWIGLKCPNNSIHWKIKLQTEVDKVPQETRQKILDLMRSGEKLGDVCKKVKLSLDVGSEIFFKNIEPYGYHLREVAL